MTLIESLLAMALVLAVLWYVSEHRRRVAIERELVPLRETAQEMRADVTAAVTKMHAATTTCAFLSNDETTGITDRVIAAAAASALRPHIVQLDAVLAR